MESQQTANNITEPASNIGETTVKPNVPLPPQGFQARPQGPPPSPRNSINNGPIGPPRPGQPPHTLRRLDSRSSLGSPASGQFVQLRPYGPPRPPGSSFPPRSPQPGQLPPQNPPYLPNQRFAHSPGIRGPPLQPGGQRPPFAGNYQTLQQQQYHQQQQQQQQQQRNNDPRFQRPIPDIASQGELSRTAEAVPHRVQESVFPRQLQRNDSSVSLQRQQLSTNEEIKQPTRPRIIIEKMEDIDEIADNVRKPHLQGRRSEARENGENDDDDDVVMDNERSPRSNGAGGGGGGLMNGSKSPLTSEKHDDVSQAASRPGTAISATKAEEENKRDAHSRPISANNNDKIAKELIDVPAPGIAVSRPASAVSADKEEERQEKSAGRPPSSKRIDIADESTEDSANDETPLSVNDAKSDTTSRPTSAVSMSEPAENWGKPGSPYGNDAMRNIEHGSKTPLRSLDGSRLNTPSHLDTSQHAEQEPGAPSKTPDKSRSSTPIGPESSGNAEQELRTPIKTPDKSRSATPAGSETSRSAEKESRTPSNTPDKSRSTTPAEFLLSPNTTKSRSSTPAEAEPNNDGGSIGTELATSENVHADKSGQDTLRVTETSRPTSSLGSPNSVIEAGGKSPRTPKSPRSLMTPESQRKLSVPGSAGTSPGSPRESVKGFDNGQQRSLSARTSPDGTRRSPSSPKSPDDSAKQTEGERKRTSFVEDLPTATKMLDTAEKGITRAAALTSPSKPATPAVKTRRVQPPTRLDNGKAERKSPRRKAVENGRANGSQAVPTTNGDIVSPDKKSPSKIRDSDKGSTAGSPTKSPTKSVKSLPRTPETPPSTAQEKKKVPMNKVQVGAAPSPNLKTVRSKIGSLENTSYKPGGGKVKIENRKLDFSKAQPKIAAKNEKYAPSGGDKKISQVKLQWNAKSKIGSLENATYKPGGGDKKIETVKLDFKDKAKPKVGSKENTKHVPGGGTVKSATPSKTPQEAKNHIPMQKIDIKAESKIGSLDNVKHKPGGGDKKIFNDRDYLRQTSSNVESLNGSGSQIWTPANDDLPKDSKTNDTDTPQPQPPPSTPTRARTVTSPLSIVTPRAVRSGLAKSPEVTTSRTQFVYETEGPMDLTDGHTSKTLSPDTADSKRTPKGRSPRVSISPRPPSSLSVKSVPGTPRNISPGTPRITSSNTSRKTSPNTPRSPKELLFPKLASSPIPQEASSVSESHSKITLPKLIEPSSQSTKVAY